MSATRLMSGLVALFVLTIIFTYFDPVVEDTIYGFGSSQITEDAPQQVIDKYLGGWQFWIPAFLLAIFVLVVSAGAERNNQNI